MVLRCSNLLRLARTIIDTAHGCAHDKMTRIQMWFRDPGEGRATGPPQGLAREPGSSSLCFIPLSASKPLCSPGRAWLPHLPWFQPHLKTLLEINPSDPKQNSQDREPRWPDWVQLPSLVQSTVGRTCGDRSWGVTSSGTPPLWL